MALITARRTWWDQELTDTSTNLLEFQVRNLTAFVVFQFFRTNFFTKPKLHSHIIRRGVSCSIFVIACPDLFGSPCARAYIVCIGINHVARRVWGLLSLASFYFFFWWVARNTVFFTLLNGPRNYKVSNIKNIKSKTEQQVPPPHLVCCL